jgi:hypothetical protein
VHAVNGSHYNDITIVYAKSVLAAVLQHHKQLQKRRHALFKRIRKVALVAEVKKRRKFSPRKVEGRPLYEQSTWGLMLTNPRFQDPNDRKGGQQFRRRFRVPYPVFLEIVRMTRESGWFSEGPDAVGIKAAPLEPSESSMVLSLQLMMVISTRMCLSI